MNIENCVAMVTGANRGLGKSFIDALLAGGAAKIYAGSRNPQSVNVSDKRVVPVKLDIISEVQVKSAAEACPDVNVLINNAGIMKSSPMLAADSEAALRDEMEVNVFGTLRMVRAFAPVLAKNGGGAIANILSVTSWVTYPHNATYAATKHASLALTDAVRYQLKSQGTQVVAVFSGYIDTDMAASVTHLPKVSPLQVAERTLAGIREGQNRAYADERTEDTWKAVKSDLDGLQATIQQRWDASQAK